MHVRQLRNGSIEVSASSFEEQFDHAFDQLDNKGMNWVRLLDLRHKFPSLSVDEFNAELRQLRMEDKYDLGAYEGTHGVPPSEEERDTRIEEGGQKFYFVRRVPEWQRG